MQGKVLNKRYGIIRSVAETALSHCYLAEDLMLPGNPSCCVEVFRLSQNHPKLLKAGQHLFQKEATLLKTLTADAALLTVQDFFVQEAVFYLIQDWLEGVTLAEQFQAAPQGGDKFKEDEVIALLQQVLDALTVVHDHATVHGNLSPQSLILHPVEQTWLLKDFGAVRQISLLRLNSQAKVTLRRRVGDPHYCPPHWSGKLSPAYDLYALGRIALQALTGTAPQDFPEDWQSTVAVSDRLRPVLHGLLSQTYNHAGEAQQWLRGTAATAIGDIGAALTQFTQLDDAPKTQVKSQPTANPVQTPLPEVQLLAGRYRLLETLGDGGFGRTFLSQDEQFPGTPKCVVKQLRPYSTTSELLALARRFFLSEAEVLSRLGQHPQIPHLLAHFEEDQEFYLVQEYVEGQDLTAELQRSKRWSEPKVLRLLRDILEVLSFVHEQQVIHRDIKPDNIRRRPDGKVVLIDFGAVKQVGEKLVGNEPTQLTVAIGTPGYAPSEQTQGKPRLSSDVYAVGVIAIEALTGIDPEKLPEDPRTGELVWHDRAKVSPALQGVIDRMVRYDFRQRYATAQDALTALETMGSTQATVVRSLEKLQKSQHFPKPWLWGSVAAGVLVLGTVGVTQLLSRPAANSTDPANANESLTSETGANAPEVAIAQLAANVIPLGFQVQDAAYSDALNRLVMVSINPNQLHFYSPLSQRLQSVALNRPPLSVAIEPQGQFAAISQGDSVAIVNIAQAQVIQVIPVTVSVHDVVLANSRWVYFSAARDGRLWGIDLDTQEVIASDTGNFQQSRQTLLPSGRGLVSLDTTGRTLRYVDIGQGTPQPTFETTSTNPEPLGQQLWLTGDGQAAFTDQGMRLWMSQLRDAGQVTGESLALTHPRSDIGGRRLAIAQANRTLFALDGDRFEQLVQFDRTTLNRQQTWQLPAIRTVQGTTSQVEGRFVFVNPQGSEYYILGQVGSGSEFSLLRGTF
ncbi:MAG: protein kinase domain-containing protein [Spirulinaceae cyanobacterium]